MVCAYVHFIPFHGIQTEKDLTNETKWQEKMMREKQKNEIL